MSRANAASRRNTTVWSSFTKSFTRAVLKCLGFPCNQFGGQEPGDEAAIKSFCETKHAVTFPMFAKIDVNGGKADPLYQFLKKESKGILGTEAIKWNFTKFLVDPGGRVTRRFAPTTSPSRSKKILSLFCRRHR